MTQGFRFCSFVLSLKQKYNLELVTEQTQTQQSSGESTLLFHSLGKPLVWFRAHQSRPGPCDRWGPMRTPGEPCTFKVRVPAPAVWVRFRGGRPQGGGLTKWCSNPRNRARGERHSFGALNLNGAPNPVTKILL